MFKCKRKEKTLLFVINILIHFNFICISFIFTVYIDDILIEGLEITIFLTIRKHKKDFFFEKNVEKFSKKVFRKKNKKLKNKKLKNLENRSKIKTI